MKSMHSIPKYTPGDIKWSYSDVPGSMPWDCLYILHFCCVVARMQSMWHCTSIIWKKYSDSQICKVYHLLASIYSL